MERSRISFRLIIFDDKIILYFFLIAGGVWHVLGVFRQLMQLLAAPTIIGIAIWILFECLRKSRFQQHKKFFIWAGTVIFGSFIIEWVGVKTGLVFGRYFYGDILQPVLFDVPIAMGFAWFNSLTGSTAIVQRIHANFSKLNSLIFAIAVAICMIMFDLVMEHAALKLGYWYWLSNSIPIQNYIAWFSISFVLMILGLQINVFQETLPPIAFHAFFAQLIYFGIVILFMKV